MKTLATLLICNKYAIIERSKKKENKNSGTYFELVSELLDSKANNLNTYFNELGGRQPFVRHVSLRLLSFFAITPY